MGEQWWSSFLLLVTISCWTFADGQTNTVELQLGTDHPANNTVVLITAIGNDLSPDGGDPLVCATQRTPCCGTLPNRFGDWYYPNGTKVFIKGVGASFYRTRRDSNSVLGGALLNRRFDAMDPTGIYHCIIPGTDDGYQTLFVGLYTNTNNGAQLSTNFVLTSAPTSQSVTFKLTCASNGGPINTMQWDKDGVPITGSSTYPDLTDASIATYTNILQVTGRETGLYTCTATDGASLSLTESFTVNAANAPLDVSARLDTTSGVVFISWDPPAAGGATVTNYRIYYTSESFLFDEQTTSTGCQFNLDLKGASLDNKMISIRAESAQLPSELVTVSVTVPSTPSTTTSVMAPTTTVSTAAITELSTTTIEASTEVIVMPSSTTQAPSTAEQSEAPTINMPIMTTAPESIVQLISDIPNPILSGSSLTLSCILELSDVADNVTMVINGPRKKFFPSTTSPAGKSFGGLRYISSITLKTLESIDSGEYNCTVNVSGIEVVVSTKTNILIVDGMFQLRLKSVEICQQWYSKNLDEYKQYSNFIMEALIEAIERRCKCHFPATNLLEESFSCYDSPNLMTYRNTLLDTQYFNGTQIIDFIQDWVTTGPRIKIGKSHVRVDGSCPVAISSLDEPECGQEKEDRLCDDDPQYAMCAEHLKDENISNCFKGCVIRNGS